MTIHKAQGSEFERVEVVLPARDSRVLTRELLYTALTRARTSVRLWARAAVLRDTITRRSTQTPLGLWEESGR
jgi:exodeoxyribonuclease V alpha subunit